MPPTPSRSPEPSAPKIGAWRWLTCLGFPGRTQVCLAVQCGDGFLQLVVDQRRFGWENRMSLRSVTTTLADRAAAVISWAGPSTMCLGSPAARAERISGLRGGGSSDRARDCTAVQDLAAISVNEPAHDCQQQQRGRGQGDRGGQGPRMAGGAVPLTRSSAESAPWLGICPVEENAQNVNFWV